MKSLIMLFGIAICTMVCIAAPQRSILGASGTDYAESGEQWVNPYITDGLIAMWDGEWNAGEGVHVDNGVWKPVVGNYQASRMVTNSSKFYDDVTYGENFASFNFCNRFSVVDDRIKDLLKSGNFTIEVCGIILGNQNGRTVILSFLGKASRIYLNSIPNWRLKGYSIGGNEDSFNIGGLSNATFTVTSESSLCSIVVNGKLKKSGISPYPVPETRPSYSGWISAGDGTDDYWNYGTKTKIFCFRIYSRKLDAEELLHNYLVDKERFGL